jgi:hypothetical protein
MTTRWVCLGLLLLTASPVRAQSAAAARAEAETAFRQKDYRRSARRFADAIERGASDPRLFYNAARAFALSRDGDRAFDYLGRSIDQGFVGVGVQPDLVVHPTVSEIRAGRDAVLDAALRSLQKK